MPIPHLEIDSAWRVGRCLLVPGAWIAETVTTALRRSTIQGAWREYLSKIVQVEAAKVAPQAALCVPGQDMEAADAIARETLAVLRLFQRARHPGTNLRRQTFGLPGDVNFTRRDYFQYEVLSTGKPSSAGLAWQRPGFLAGWTFGSGDRLAYRKDMRFRLLDQALRARRRSQLESRLLHTILLISQGSTYFDPSLEVALLAVGYELLLSEGVGESERHRVSQRVAYSTCLAQCGHGDVPPCHYLISTSRKRVVLETRRLQHQGRHGLCSAYMHTDQLFGLRNAVLHEGAVLDDDAAGHHAWRMDRFLLDFLGAAVSDPIILESLGRYLPAKEMAP